MKEEDSLKIGRINRATERALGISLSGDVNIYMSNEELDKIAAKRPHDYLRYTQEITTILKTPDFVSFDIGPQSFYFGRFYPQEDRFSWVLVEVKQIGHVYRFIRILNGGKMPLGKELGRLKWARPIDKKIPESEHNS